MFSKTLGETFDDEAGEEVDEANDCSIGVRCIRPAPVLHRRKRMRIARAAAAA